ncbi:putative adenosylhomocysteine nucleosidase [Helianthus debilis subsp. tardiflorus]
MFSAATFDKPQEWLHTQQNPLLKYPEYKPSNLIIDVAGRRFRFGSVGNKRLILVMTGLGMVLSIGCFSSYHLNSGVTTQLLLSLFDIEGVVHYGIAGNANPSLNIGDVVIPHYWTHSALWSWQLVQVYKLASSWINFA